VEGWTPFCVLAATNRLKKPRPWGVWVNGSMVEIIFVTNRLFIQLNKQVSSDAVVYEAGGGDNFGPCFIVDMKYFVGRPNNFTLEFVA
jgi:hypothetical protein